MLRTLLALMTAFLLAGCCCAKPRCCTVAAEPTLEADRQRAVEAEAQRTVDAAPKPENPYTILARKRVKGLVWEDTTLDQAASYIRTISGLNVYISPKVREEKMDGIRLNAQLDDVSLRDVLRVVMTEPWELTFEVRQGNVIWIMTQDEVDQTMRLRYYDVKDLVGVHAPDESTGPVRHAPRVDEAKAEALVARIRKSVAPAGWDREDVTMEARNGILIVRAPRKTLNDLDAFLTQLRRAQK